VIVVEGLTKTYKARAVISDVSFVANAGEVTGFLGPNGAGKSTTLRALVGLVRQDSGTATVLGHCYRDLPEPARRVGVLLDASTLHPGRTGRDTLAATARYLRLPSRRADEVLDLVGLSVHAGRQRVRAYSLGMRQRLGLAHALLGDPEVLVLDEPANGLDPEGIRWMRGLLVDFAGSGRTVLLSSHLLSEVEKVADRAVIIRDGRIVADGYVQDLLGHAATLVRTDDDAGLRRAVSASGLVVLAEESGVLKLQASPDVVGDLCRREGLGVRHLVAAPTSSLEDIVIVGTDMASTPKEHHVVLS